MKTIKQNNYSVKLNIIAWRQLNETTHNPTISMFLYVLLSKIWLYEFIFDIFYKTKLR